MWLSAQRQEKETNLKTFELWMGTVHTEERCVTCVIYLFSNIFFLFWGPQLDSPPPPTHFSFHFKYNTIHIYMAWIAKDRIIMIIKYDFNNIMTFFTKKSVVLVCIPYFVWLVCMLNTLLHLVGKVWALSDCSRFETGFNPELTHTCYMLICSFHR